MGVVKVYVTGISIALVGLAIWKLFDSLPTDIIGIGLSGLGVLVAGSLELLGLVLLPFRLLEWLDTSDRVVVRDRKARKAAAERAAARQRTAARRAALAAHQDGVSDVRPVRNGS